MGLVLGLLCVMLVGMVGIVVPVVPGLVMIWGACLVYGIVHGFTTGGVILFVLISLLCLAGMASDYVLPRRAAAGAGASKSSIWFGVLGATAGFFFIPYFGMIIGGIGGIFLAEYMRTNDTAESWAATLATLKAFGWSMALQLALGALCIVLFGVWALLPE